jgi:hypothetical protein
MVRIIIDDKTYRIVKRGRIQKGDLVWNIETKTFEKPKAYSSQIIECYYMVIR